MSGARLDGATVERAYRLTRRLAVLNAAAAAAALVRDRLGEGHSSSTSSAMLRALLRELDAVVHMLREQVLIEIGEAMASAGGEAQRL